MTPSLDARFDADTPAAFLNGNHALIRMMDSALKYASGMAIIPGGWVSGNDINEARWIQIIRSHKARFRAGVARTPTERAAVDWNAVIADNRTCAAQEFLGLLRREIADGRAGKKT